MAFPWQQALANLPDLGRAMSQAQAFRANQMAIEAKEREIDQAPRRAEAVQQYWQGQPELLQQLDPGLFTNLEDHRAGQRKQQFSELEAVQKRRDEMFDRKLEMMGRAVGVVSQHPQASGQIQQWLGQSGMFQDDELAALADPEQAAQMAQALPQLAGQAREDLKLVSAGEKNAVANFRAQYGDAPYREMVAHPEWGDFLEAGKREALTSKKAGATQISVGDGKAAIEAGTKKRLEGELLEQEEILQDLQLLQSSDPQQYLGATGRIKTWVLGKLDYVVSLDPQSEEFLMGAQQLIETTEGIFNKYRKFITGAQASEKELERLQKAMLNKDLSPTQFKASMDRLFEKITRAMRIRRRVMREGTDISAAPATDQARDLKRDIQPRLRELLGEGYSPDGAAGQMVTEGLWNQDTADDWLLRAQQ